MKSVLLPLLLLLYIVSCHAPASSQDSTEAAAQPVIVPGAYRLPLYLNKLQGKRVGMVVNHTSTISTIHLVDTLLAHGVDIVKIFSPEHGFRGDADAGAKVDDTRDTKTSLPIISLYGSNKKPHPEQVAGLDIIVFDIQDVGVRFYTYISTLTYVMEAAASQGIPVVVLDRPNPNGHYVDGPLLDKAFASFVGMHPVPIVYGLTIGEYAKMVNGQGWLADQLACVLTIIPCQHYRHDRRYDVPIAPSPNLPNARSIALYPGLCLMEGTIMSVGRGTDLQFQIYGHPSYEVQDWSFVPEPWPGAHEPKLQGQRCYGVDLSRVDIDSVRETGRLDLGPLLDAYKRTPSDQFFLKSGFFDKLAGTSSLRQALLEGQTEAEIRASWQDDLVDYMAIRQKYLIYP